MLPKDGIGVTCSLCSFSAFDISDWSVVIEALDIESDRKLLEAIETNHPKEPEARATC
jgi:hypothetical protein